MAVLSGVAFKTKYSGPWFKWLRKDMTHNGFTYSLGLNIDSVKFNPTGSCQPGGLYLMKKIKHLTEFYSYGAILGIFDIPDDAQVYIENKSKFKCDRVSLLKTVSSEVDLVEYFKKAKEKGCRLDYDLCMYAAANGQLEILKWLRENGQYWGPSTCNAAAENGHLEVIKWARENGCPWDYNTCYYAESNRHFEVLKWLEDNGCPFYLKCQF